MRAPDATPTRHYPPVGDDPDVVRAVEAGLLEVSATLADVAGEVGDAGPRLRVAWPAGPAGEAARHDLARTTDWVRRAAPGLSRVAAALADYADALVGERRRVDDLEAARALLAPAEAALRSATLAVAVGGLAAVTVWEAADAGVRVARSRAGFGSCAEVDAAWAAVVRRVERHADECATALTRAAAGETVLGSVRGASAYAASLALLTAGGLPAFLARAGLVSLPTDSEGVRAFWAGLSSAEREALVRSDPVWVGNLAGVPARDRDHANRLARAADEAQGTALLRAAGLEPPTTVAGLDALLAHLTPTQLAALGSTAGPWGLGLRLRPEVLQRLGVYRNALAVATVLTAAGPAGAPALLLVYEPRAYPRGAGPEGRAAVAYGDPDTADDVVLCVPGLESRVATLDLVAGDAAALWREAAAADPDRTTSVIAWQGYTPPSGSPSLARAGPRRARTCSLPTSTPWW